MLNSIFNPRSVAIIGASRDEKKVGHAILKNLISSGYRGKIYPVNPQAEEILGIRCYKSLKEINMPVELVVVCVPPAFTLQVIKEAIDIQVKAAVIITAGFKETGPEGAKLEEEIKKIAKDKIKIVGPNCLGVINTSNGLNATFASITPPGGRVSLFSQSGALGAVILELSYSKNIGIAKFISLGNKMDVTEIDCLEYFMKDPDTDVILGYIEDVTDGKKFLEVAKKLTKIKPVILIKAGGTKYGARAASSHTGALAGSDVAFDTASKQAGLIRAKGIDEFFFYGIGLAKKKLLDGNRLLIITNAGGPGILAADACEKNGFELPVLSKETIEALKEKLPKNASLYNPVDIIGDADAERYKFVLEKVINEENIDGIMIILTAQAMTEVEKVAEIIIEKDRKTSKPIFCCFMGDIKVKKAYEMFQANNIPAFPYPEATVSVFKKLYDFSRWKKRPLQEPIDEFGDIKKEEAYMLMSKFISKKNFQIKDSLAMEFLSCYGLKFPKRGFAKTPQEAVEVAKQIGYPVVMKVSSPEILHKTEVGGVKLNLKNDEEVEKAFLEITINAKKAMHDVFIEGVNIYQMVKAHRELIVGASYDRTFGHMIAVGLGGIYVEVLNDISFRIVPISKTEAYEMISELKAYKILKGIRGEKPVDIDAVVEVLLRISQLLKDFPQIIELDINPLACFEKEVLGLDARIIISDNLFNN
ncbi:MAG: acetate--CoA ligase family protein [Endomicrobiia bacterium]